jgi:hypothetical protein
MYLRLFLLVIFSFSFFEIWSQKVIRIKNPSFERDFTKDTKNARFVQLDEWNNWGTVGESPYWIQPGYFNCTTKAKDGDTYVSLVCRPNGTHGGIGQFLSQLLKKDSIYEFSIHLAKSADFSSGIMPGGNEVSFGSPVAFLVVGFNNKQESEILGAINQVDHTDWRSYDFRICPKKIDCEQLVFFAQFTNDKKKYKFYPGNILIDKMSDIVMTRNTELKNNIVEPYYQSLTFPLKAPENVQIDVEQTQVIAEKKGISIANNNFSGWTVWLTNLQENSIVPTETTTISKPPRKPEGNTASGVVLFSDNHNYAGVVIPLPDSLILLQGETRSIRLRTAYVPDEKYNDPIDKNQMKIKIWGATDGTPIAELLYESTHPKELRYSVYFSGGSIKLSPLNQDYNKIYVELVCTKDYNEKYHGGSLYVQDCIFLDKN